MEVLSIEEGQAEIDTLDAGVCGAPALEILSRRHPAAAVRNGLAEMCRATDAPQRVSDSNRHCLRRPTADHYPGLRHPCGLAEAATHLPPRYRGPAWAEGG